MNEEPLSNFIKYKESIDVLDIDNDILSIESKLTNMLNAMSKSHFNDETLDLLSQDKKEILKNLEKFNNTVSKFKNDTVEFIKKSDSKYLSQSYKMYEDGLSQDNPDYILDRALFNALIYRDEIEYYLKSRIQKYSNWKYSGMFIRPEHGKYVDSMTASDPLYIVDNDLKLLNPVKSLWNEEYQRRIRYRVIDEVQDGQIFKNFPKNQLNFIMVMNFFNHRPLNIIDRYLVEMYDLLSDGGVIIFTYNNCDLSLAVKNFEKSMYSYTPKSRLLSIVEKIGYHLIEDFDEPNTNVSWLEIKKPGNTDTLRGGQCIAKVNI